VSTVVILCYNDAPVLDDCNCSVAYNDATEDGFMSSDQAQRSIDGEIIRQFEPDIIQSYLEESFQDSIADSNKPLKDLIDKYGQLRDLTVESFHISTIRTVRETILSNKRLRLIMEDELDLDIFGVYLYGIINIPMYDLPTIIDFVCSYLSQDSLPEG
jgi:hypothetical protein